MKFKFNKTIIAVAVTAVMLQACGGGGGNPIIRPDSTSTGNVPFYTPTKIANISTSPSVVPSNLSTVGDIFTADLSGSGSQNVIFAGRVVQDANNTPWVNSQITIFGWQNGQLVNQTSQWFSGTDNVIVGTEPSVKFGDFLGNGKIGMYVANSTDRAVYGPDVVFINNGSSFTRVELNTGNNWAHDSVVYDFNRDGKSDIFNTDYGSNTNLSFSNGNGTFTTYRNDPAVSPWVGGSSVAAGDFLGNGSTTIIITDTNTGKQDTKLFGWSISSGSLVFTDLGTLPMGRFDLPKWASYNFGGDPNGKMSHNVRVLAFDFDNSGTTSAVVFARPVLTNGLWPTFSEVQFLKNNGSGTFTDVTDSVLVGYNTATPVSYNPKLLDFNGDGLTDIFLSGADGTASVARVLIHTSDNKYVDSYINVFQAFQNQAYNTQAALGWAKSAGNTVNVVQGPNNELYLITAITYLDNGGYKQAVYLSKLGTQTTTAQALSTAVKQTWPFLSDTQVNQVLARTSTTWFGLNILDPTQALSPLGSLGFNAGQQFTGYLGGVNLNSLRTPVYMFDSIGRNFAVNLAPTVPTNLLNAWSRQIDNISDDTRGAQLMDMPMTKYNGLKFGGDSNTKTLALGITGIKVGKGLELSAQYTELPFSPFIQMMGSYGSVRSSTMLETTLTRRSDNWVSKAGMIYSNTQFYSGAVTRVSPITSVWAEAGWEDEKWKFYAGMLPKVVAGSVDLRLPTGVDPAGNIQYNNISARVTNPTTEYVRLSYRERLHKGVYFNLHAMTTTQHQTSVLGEFRINY
jgi:hypothetical protein